STEEPVFCVRNVDRQRGTFIRDLALRALQQAHVDVPEPDGRKKTRLRVGRGVGLRSSSLFSFADSLLELLLHHHPEVPLLAVTAGEQQRWENLELVVRTPNDSSIKRHIDMGAKNHLLFIFNLGLASQNMAWPCSCDEVSLRLESGDVVIFNGKTEHAAPEVFAGTSPFPQDIWLGSRRVGVLIRQEPSKRSEKWVPPSRRE
ncbi:unnamed protein product, partial [Polarella glacialis]